MRLRLLSVGRKMPSWVREGVDNYARRMPRHLGFQLVEVAPGQGPDPAAVRRAESEILLKIVDGNSRLIALDERGKPWTTEDLSAEMESWLNEGQDTTLMIGGAEGLDARCRDRAQKIWSLGPLTLPHMLVRIIVTEQLYRAWSLLQGHPYHRKTVR